MGKLTIKRVLIYLLGLVILALGLTLNTKTSLGAGAIVTVPFTISELYNLNFGNVTLVVYCLFVIVEIILDKSDFLFILLQIPLSVVFTRFMNLFKAIINLPCDYLWFRLIMTFVAIFLTDLGIFLTVRMNLILNPGDGIVTAISKRFKIELGKTKNIVDFTCVIISIVLGSIYHKPFVGVGIGTILSMIFIGRVLSLLNKKFPNFSY